ncbi:hypothetical protein EVAR_18403_1 [Eumeta japonica]|uniref:Uncharacterized protein n=1 Tax=Eumeta variegata TaxID=151549 RepID=A0A4C1UTV1_EUMVA|nr:hypothetical protein EVAR_18403_1 [Eumeta japonica]
MTNGISGTASAPRYLFHCARPRWRAIPPHGAAKEIEVYSNTVAAIRASLCRPPRYCRVHLPAVDEPDHGYESSIRHGMGIGVGTKGPRAYPTFESEGHKHIRSSVRTDSKSIIEIQRPNPGGVITPMTPLKHIAQRSRRTLIKEYIVYVSFYLDCCGSAAFYALFISNRSAWTLNYPCRPDENLALPTTDVVDAMAVTVTDGLT